MASQVFQPGVPYRGAVPNGLHDGKMIEINGKVPYGAERFEINLVTGLDSHSDRPLHLSVRLDDRVVVRNSFERNRWGHEERHGVFPFSSGRDFAMMILVDPDAYRIAIDNQHCWEFHHRMPIHRVSSLTITGSVMIERIEFIDKAGFYQPGILPSIAVYPSTIDPGFMPSRPGVCVQPRTVYPAGRVFTGYVVPSQPGVCIPPRTVYPTPQVTTGYVVPGMPTVIPSFPMIPDIGTCIPPPEQRFQPGYISTGQSNLAPVYNPSIPYAYPIYGGIRPGMTAHISGRPSISANKFTINFQNGTSPYPPPDIAFHLDVRFYERTVVRNSRTNNVWVREMREDHLATYFPFQQGVHFDMMIRVEGDRYMVALNGQHLLEFRHRLYPFERFDTLHIENDVEVDSIRFS